MPSSLLSIMTIAPLACWCQQPTTAQNASCRECCMVLDLSQDPGDLNACRQYCVNCTALATSQAKYRITYNKVPKWPGFIIPSSTLCTDISSRSASSWSAMTGQLNVPRAKTAFGDRSFPFGRRPCCLEQSTGWTVLPGHIFRRH